MTIEHLGLTIRIKQDEDAQNPRTDYDHFGKIVHWHRRYDFGERIDNPNEWRESLPKGSVVLPLSLLDHSGLHMWIGSGPHSSDSAGWDSGAVGFIYATPESIRKEYGVKRITKGVQAKVEKLLTAEIEEFDQYLGGEVYGYVIEDEDGNHLDSCWGFYGLKYCEEQAKEAATHAAKNRDASGVITVALAGCASLPNDPDSPANERRAQQLEERLDAAERGQK